MRRLLGALGLTLAWSLACGFVPDEVKKPIADGIAEAIAAAMHVPRAQVKVAALDNGRWRVTTPSWGASCAIWPEARKPKGFAFEPGNGLLADCKAAADCEEVLGVTCGDGLELGLAITAQPGSSMGDLQERRTRELEGRGWQVAEGRDPKHPEAVLLHAREGKRVRAVAILDVGEDGTPGELLVSVLD